MSLLLLLLQLVLIVHVIPHHVVSRSPEHFIEEGVLERLDGDGDGALGVDFGTVLVNHAILSGSIDVLHDGLGPGTELHGVQVVLHSHDVQYRVGPGFE